MIGMFGAQVMLQVFLCAVFFLPVGCCVKTAIFGLVVYIRTDQTAQLYSLIRVCTEHSGDS